MLDAKKWVDPRDVDWTDSFNPLARNGWRRDVNPYVDMIFEHPVWVAIRRAENTEPRLLTVPDQQNAVIQPGATYDQSLTYIDPHSWLIGISCSSQFPPSQGGGGGFYLQILDSQSGKYIYSAPILSNNAGLGNGGTAQARKGVVSYFAVPHCFVPPAYPIVRIINNSVNAQICQVVLWTVAEMDL